MAVAQISKQNAKPNLLSSKIKEGVTRHFIISRNLHGSKDWDQKSVMNFFKGQDIVYKHEHLIERILPELDDSPAKERAIAVLSHPEHMQKVAEKIVGRKHAQVQNLLKEMDKGEKPYTHLFICINIINKEIIPIIDKYYKEPARSNILIDYQKWTLFLSTLHAQEKKMHEAKKTNPKIEMVEEKTKDFAGIGYAKDLESYYATGL